MRVLLDECLPRRLKRELVGHDARTAPEMGWASKRNGELLALAVGQFDAFLTADRNLSYQQDVSSFDIAIVVLVARSNSEVPNRGRQGDPAAGDASGLVGIVELSGS